MRGSPEVSILNPVPVKRVGTLHGAVVSSSWIHFNFLYILKWMKIQSRVQREVKKEEWASVWYSGQMKLDVLFECFFRVWLPTPFLRHNSLNVSRETCSCWIAKVKEGKVRPEKSFQSCSLEKILQISYSGALISVREEAHFQLLFWLLYCKINPRCCF